MVGNFTQTTLDISFPATLLGLLNFARTYNSRYTTVGALGPGWTITFSASLAAMPDGTIAFHDEDGRILTFTPDSGRYRRPQDLDADLSRNDDGSFTLTFNSGEVWTFDADGRLTGRGREGQHVTVDHDGEGRPTRVAHSTGRNLTLSYGDTGRLVHVEADDGRAVSYAYTAAGALESATLPALGVIRFDTGTGGQITRITDPDGNLVVGNAYDDQGRVAHQDLPGGSGADFAYDEATNVTTVTNATTGARATFEANEQGRIAKATDPGGNIATFSYHTDGHLADAVTPGGAHLTQTYDARGNLLTNEFGGASAAWTYDESDRVISATDPAGGVTTYAYTGTSHMPSQVTDPGGGVTRTVVRDGLVISRTGPDGDTRTYGYDGAGNLTSMTDPLGGVARLDHDAAGNVTEFFSPSGATRHWEYDGAGRVTAHTDPDGSVTRFQYSAAGLLLQRTEPDGAATNYSYDAAGNRTSVTDPLGNQTRYEYNPDGYLTSVTTPDDAVTHFAHDDLGQIVGITDPLGNATTYEYDADGNNITETGPSGTIRARYDARGNPVAVTDPTDATTEYEYDAANRMTSLTDPEGGTWRLRYTPAGDVATVTDPAGASGQWAWTKAGRLDAITDPLGRRTSFTRDQAGRISASVDAEGGVTRYGYDAAGRRISVTTPAGLQTRYRYDKAGRLVATVDPRGWITRTRYDSRGRRTAVIRPSGVITRYRYDPAGHLTELTDGNGFTTRYGYDNTGRIVSITDAKGAITRYAYDKAGHLTARTDPLGRTTRHEYDAAGNLATIVDPDGHAQHMAYDADGRLTRWTADDGSEVTYAYDKAGNRTSMTDLTGTTHYTYDRTGRLLTTTGPDGDQITAGYDTAGQRTSLTYPDGRTVDYSYDQNGRLIGLHDPRAGDAAYALDPDGRLLTEELPHRMARRYHYEHGLLHRFSVIDDDHPVAETVFHHDPDGRIRTEQASAIRREYRYDRAGQLVHAAVHGPRPDDCHELGFTYDAVGNRVRSWHDGHETRYRYDDADQFRALRTHERRVEFRYDSSGRLIEESEGGWRRTVDYDGFGRPVTVTRHAPAFAERIRATYDGDGLLAALVLTDDKEWRAAEQGATVRYRWSSGDEVPEILTQRAEPRIDDAEHSHPGRLDADFVYGYGRTFASERHGGATFHHDAYGSAIRTSDTHDWVQADRYDVFGAPRHRDDHGDERHDEREHHEGHEHDEPDRADWDHPEHGEWDDQHRTDEHRVVEHRVDEHDHEHRHWEHGPRPPELPRFGYRGELALGSILDLRARCYDAELGRFTTRDPLLDGPPHPQQATNPYVYANNDPINFTDPLGTMAIAPAAGTMVTAQAAAANVTRASSATMLSQSVSMLAAKAGGDRTTLHNAAALVGGAQLAIQYAEQRGIPTKMEFEVEIPGAAKKNRPNVPADPDSEDNTGRVDIMFTYFGVAINVLIWEVKSAITSGSETARSQLAQTEARWYADVYNKSKNWPNLAGSLAEPGQPMHTPAILFGVPSAPGQYEVYSPERTFGAVLYRRLPNLPPDPIPVYEYQPQARKVVQVRGPQPSGVGLRARDLILAAGGVALLGGVAAGGAAVAPSLGEALADFFATLLEGLLAGA